MLRLIPPLWCAIYLALAGAVSAVFPWRDVIDLRILWLGILLLIAGVLLAVSAAMGAEVNGRATMRLFFGAGLAAAAVSAGHAAGYDVTEKSIAQLQADMTAGDVTSAEIVSAYAARIDAIDRSGPALHSVLAINPDAMNEARA